MSIESIIAIIVSVVFAAVATLFKMQHDAAVARIQRLEDKMDAHHEQTHAELSRTIGKLEAKVQRCEDRDK